LRAGFAVLAAFLPTEERESVMEEASHRLNVELRSLAEAIEQASQSDHRN